MDQDELNTKTASLVARAKAILVSPKTEWPVIAGESSSIADIYKSYVFPLAAIGPLCRLVGELVFGHSFFGIVYRPSIGGALATAAIGFVATLIGVYVLALVVDFLAPHFDGTADRVKAFKLAAYSSTAAWLVGVFGLLPALVFLGLLGLYSFYLFYLGVMPMMNVPEDKAPIFTGAVVVVSIVAYIIVGAVLAPVMLMFAGTPNLSTEMGGGSITLPQ